MQDLRPHFIQSLIDLAEKDNKIILISGDVGYSFAEPFIEKFPRQFLNCGIMEQSMTGIAAGMAMGGLKPHIYSMIPFITMRNYEQIRDDIAYQNTNVKIVGVQGSERYKFLGFTHNAYNNEDIKILEILPNLKIYTPISPDEVDLAIKESYKNNKPSYIRL